MLIGREASYQRLIGVPLERSVFPVGSEQPWAGLGLKVLFKSECVTLPTGGRGELWRVALRRDR